eukprot:SAG22_NODE_1600_length_4029_cov_4.088295_3_plen_45_part_00
MGDANDADILDVVKELKGAGVLLGDVLRVKGYMCGTLFAPDEEG